MKKLGKGLAALGVITVTLANGPTAFAAEADTVPAPPPAMQALPSRAPTTIPAPTPAPATTSHPPTPSTVPVPAHAATIGAVPTQAPAPAVPMTVQVATQVPAQAAPQAPAAVAMTQPVPVAPPAEIMLRPVKPLALAEEPSSTPVGYKLLFGALVGGAAFVAWKKRRDASPMTRRGEAKVRVVGRTPMGLRGEIVLVDVGSTRVLVGVTPSSMTTLAMLPDEPMDEEQEAMDPEPASRPDGLADRARALLRPRDPAPEPARQTAASPFAAARYAAVEETPRAKSTKEAAPARKRPADGALEGQARGLALALGARR